VLLLLLPVQCAAEVWWHVCPGPHLGRWPPWASWSSYQAGGGERGMKRSDTRAGIRLRLTTTMAL